MIEIRECSKTFGDICAVKKVSLDIGDREVFGLVGSNGAGKSTLLRMAAGIMQPDTGEILVDGIQVYENEEAKEKFFISRITVIFLRIIRRGIWCACTGIITPYLMYSAFLN